MSFQGEHQLRDAIETVEAQLSKPQAPGKSPRCVICAATETWPHDPDCAWLIVKAYARRGDAR